MPPAGTIAQTADWLVRAHPVVFTGRAGNQPLLADPFPLFQQNVQQNAAWWAEQYIHSSTGKRGYCPDPNSKTGLAGPRAPPYPEWRDHVLPEALRIFRARTEGVPLDTIPPVQYSMKPKADGRKDGSSGQRGILGFEWRTAPLPIMPPPMDVLLPIDAEICAAEELRDDEALECEYAAVLKMSLCDQTDAPVAKKTRERKAPSRASAPRKRKEMAPRGRKRKATEASTGASAKKQCTLADFAA